MAKRKSKALWYGKVHFHDEAPKIGCGVRGVELLKLGYKWVSIRERSTGIKCRLKRTVWEQIKPKGTTEGGKEKPVRRRATNEAGTRRARRVREKDIPDEGDRVSPIR